MSHNASHASAARAFGYRAAMDADRRTMQTEPGTYTLGRLFGIPIKVSGTFAYLALLLVVFVVLTNPAEAVNLVILLALLMAALLLHELGHALVAQRFGVHVIDIRFWHMGGMARMSDIPEVARTEAWIALAGPLVNLLLAAAAAPLLLLTGSLGTTGTWVVSGFVLLNLLLGALNLLPAFPMDGGRVLRAALSTRHGYLAATETSTRVGRWVALGMVIAGASLGGVFGFLLAVLVAGFVVIAGTKELFLTRLRHTGSPIGPNSSPLTLLLVPFLLKSQASAFARPRPGGARDGGPFGGGPFGGGPFGGGPFGGGPFGATGSGPDAAHGPREADARDPSESHGAGSASAPSSEPSPKSEPSPGTARRPDVESDPFEDAPRERRGFSDADVERLERFRGRLRRNGD